MPYTAEISRTNPSCLLFLIDQSGSMGDPFGGELVRSEEVRRRSKADRLADAINNLFSALIDRCVKDQAEGPRDYYDVGVITYGNSVGAGLGGRLAGRDLVSIRELADNPMHVEPRTRSVENGLGGLVQETVNFATWFAPVASGGTPMCQALYHAWELLQPWVQTHAGSRPPMVFNITDGEATDGDPQPGAEALRALETMDGNVVLCNVHLSSLPGTAILYPENEAALPDEFARQLFAMSSLLPPHIREALMKAGYIVGQQARGFVFNAHMEEVIMLLDHGTRTNLR